MRDLLDAEADGEQREARRRERPESRRVETRARSRNGVSTKRQESVASSSVRTISPAIVRAGTAWTWRRRAKTNKGWCHR